MTVLELVNSMTKEYREFLWDIFIDDWEIEARETDDPEYLNREVQEWYTEAPYVADKWLAVKMVIYTKGYE